MLILFCSMKALRMVTQNSALSGPINPRVPAYQAEIFNLPENDYLPYLQTRDFEDYVTTSGFGLGWQRLVQWLTNQPYIYEATIFPRTHLIPNP